MAITLEDARKLAAEGRLAERMLPPDYPLGHLKKIDIPGKYAKQVVNGAKIPAEALAEDVRETENLRVCLHGEFWGIMKRDGEQLVWKVQIAPEGLMNN